MSDMQDFSAYRAEEAESMAVMPAQAKAPQGNAKIKDIDHSMDGQSYFLGEVPQAFLVDPQAFLPLNSDRLVGSVNMIEKLISDVAIMIQEEVTLIQKHQKKINAWEEQIERNKAVIQKNQMQIKQNLVDISYDKKNRDYWWNRAEQVLFDYQYAEASCRASDWAWLIKKYGLKNADGTQIDEKSHCVEELSQGAANNLSAEYKTAGNKYEIEKKDKEAFNTRMMNENGRLLTTNEQLQGFISQLYANEIEPLQDGVLMLKELGVKLKAMGQDSAKATYGDLRAWAEAFIDEFLKTNSKVPQNIVTQFRGATSTPLPAKNS